MDRIYQHDGTTLIRSHRFAKCDEDFIQHIEEAKERMKSANIRWSVIFKSLLNNLPSSVGKQQICSFCQISSSTYDRLRISLPGVKSGTSAILNLILASGRYENESQVEYIFTRHVHARSPIEESTLDDMVFRFVASTYSYEKDIIPLLKLGKPSPFFAFKHLAETFVLQRSESPITFIRKLVRQGCLSFDAVSEQAILILPALDKYGFPLKDSDGKPISIKHIVTKGNKKVLHSTNDTITVYVSFLNHIDDQIRKIWERTSRDLHELIDSQCELLSRRKKRRISINNIPLPKKTLSTKYSRYINNPAIDPFTRDNIITLGVHLAMTYEQIDHMLEVLHMDPLVYKTSSDCMLLYILGQLEKGNKLDISMSYSDIEEVAKSQILLYLFEDDYEPVKSEVMKYFEGYQNNN